jgi:predicted CopG family antitoxin
MHGPRNRLSAPSFPSFPPIPSVRSVDSVGRPFTFLGSFQFVSDSCMPTKTITLELDAYEKLAAPKRGRESFSSVVRRCILPSAPRDGAAVVAVLRERRRFLTEHDLTRLEAVDRTDSPPDNPWQDPARVSIPTS